MSVEKEINFDLRLVPRADRFEFWHDVGSLVYRPVAPRYPDLGAIAVESQIVQLGGIAVGRMQASEQYYERTQQMLRRDAVDSFMLVVLEAGTFQWQGVRHQFTAEPGSVVLLDNADLCVNDWSQHLQYFAAIPRQIVRQCGGTVAGTQMLPAAHPYSSLLRQHLSQIWQQRNALSIEDAAGVARGLVALTNQYFSGLTACPIEDCIPQSGDLLKSTIQTWIEQNLSRPELDAQTLIREFHLSRSSLYKLFEPEGGVRAYIQGRRLERAHAILSGPSAGGLSIGRLAKHLCFTSPSVFSRAFKDRWGVTAKELRDQTLHTAVQNDRRALEDAGGPLSGDSSNKLREGCSRYYALIRKD